MVKNAGKGGDHLRLDWIRKISGRCDWRKNGNRICHKLNEWLRIMFDFFHNAKVGDAAAVQICSTVRAIAVPPSDKLWSYAKSVPHDPQHSWVNQDIAWIILRICFVTVLAGKNVRSKATRFSASWTIIPLAKPSKPIPAKIPPSARKLPP